MFSVLLSVYYKENPIYLQAALDSIWTQQTVAPNEIVLVKDGPLTVDLDRVIDEFGKNAPVTIIPLKKNVGLGQALNKGLKYCSNDIVARMDTDDIAFPARFEKQIKFLNDNHDVDIVGSWLDEFEGDPNNLISRRKVPEEMNEIKEFLKKRNPLMFQTFSKGLLDMSRECQRYTGIFLVIRIHND